MSRDTIRVYVDGRTVELTTHEHRTCAGCQYWTARQCTLLSVELPGYPSPSRPALCLSAEGEARARDEIQRARAGFEAALDRWREAHQ